MENKINERNDLSPDVARETLAERVEKPRMWVLHCPFKKSGFPVVGTFGKTTKPVVIMTMETWKKLCQDVPQLQTTYFEVGSYVEDED